MDRGADLAVVPSIVFDFDGTLALGHAPVLAYARAVAPHAGAGFVEQVEAELASFDTGTSNHLDGYHVVAEVAGRHGVSSGTMKEAYLESRGWLGTDKARVGRLPGLNDFLAELHGIARLAVATNAPATGVEGVLSDWGVREYFAELHVNVGKPAGLRPIIVELVQRGPVLSVGDIVDYDLAPALELGADTALVGATALTSTAEVTFRGATLTDLYDDILAWARRSAKPTHPVSR